MAHLTSDQLLTSLKWRYATKQFDASRKIPAEIWATLEQVMVLSPSSFGVQPWKFLVIDDPSLREKLKAAAWNQNQVLDCSHFVVLTHRMEITEADVDRMIHTTSAIQGTPREALSGYRDLILQFARTEGFDTAAWSARQVYIALGFLMEAAALLGIDTCPMEGMDLPTFDNILGLKEKGYQAVVACCLGYRAPTDHAAARTKVRFPHTDVVEHV